jgi:16S rRNA U516 pseudouridylate synthase RsuA-like enzyme
VVHAKDGEHAIVSIVVKEGRNRQVRNMCEAIGIRSIA